MKFADSKELCAYVRERHGSTVLLAFSTGKDALAALAQLRETGFERIVPFYRYSIPGLEFVEESLRYYEEHVFRAPIYRVPHPGLARMLKNFVHQTPERCVDIERSEIVAYTYEQANATVRRRAGLAPDVFVAVGDRAADSPSRRFNVLVHGPINERNLRFAPVFDWRADDVDAALVRHGFKLPVDYELFFRTFDGIDHRFLEPIKRRFPRDYAKILQWFPLADLDLWRRTWAA